MKYILFVEILIDYSIGILYHDIIYIIFIKKIIINYCICVWVYMPGLVILVIWFIVLKLYYAIFKY